MIAFNANVNYDLLNKLRALNQDLHDEAHAILRDSVSRYARQMVEKRLINSAPPQVWRGPWTSEKQQRAYWATRGFGRWSDDGPPTVRTNGLKKWHVRAQYRAKSRFGEIIVNNTEIDENHTFGHQGGDNVPFWQYVIGNRQQEFHKNAGWYNVYEEIDYIKGAVGNWAILAFQDLLQDKLDDLS